MTIEANTRGKYELWGMFLTLVRCSRESLCRKSGNRLMMAAGPPTYKDTRAAAGLANKIIIAGLRGGWPRFFRGSGPEARVSRDREAITVLPVCRRADDSRRRNPAP